MHHDNLIKFMLNDDTIEYKYLLLKERCYDINLIGDVLLKIQLIRHLEKDYSINVFNLNGDPEKVIKFNEKQFKLIKKVFRNGKSKPQNMYEAVKVYVQLAKSMKPA